MSFGDREFESVVDFFSFCNDVLERHEKRLTLFISLANEKFGLEETADIAKKKQMFFNYKKIANKLYKCSLGVRKCCIEAYVITYDNYWIFVLSEDTEAHSLKSFIRNMSPLLKLCYLDTKKISGIIQNLEGLYDEIYLVEGLINREGEKIKSWKQEPVIVNAEIFKNMEREEYGKWLNVKIKFGNRGKSGWGTVRIYSVSQITIYRGKFVEIYEKLVNRYIKGAMSNDKFFTGREIKLRDDQELEIQPVTISFSEEITKNQIDLLKTKLSKSFMSTVVYSGNPFLLIQLTDKQDGSSYDFYARQNRIDIVPLIKANSSSFSHLFAMTNNILPAGEVVT